jgi:hypothetical protein
MKATIATNLAGDWRRVYIEGELIVEGSVLAIPVRPLRLVLRRCGVVITETEQDFDLLGEAGGQG